MKDFRRLVVWRKAHALTLLAYSFTRRFPNEERFGLVSQIRRCSASIAANIAEGCGRTGNGELHRFLQISSGSGSELEYHFLLAHDLGFLSNADYETLRVALVEVRRMLTALIEKVNQDRAFANC